MSLKESFEAAVAASKQLSARPDNETLLRLYGLYKQATEGDMPADAPVPGMFDFVGKAKYDAWKGLAGKTSDEAMTEYTALVTQLKGH